MNEVFYVTPFVVGIALTIHGIVTASRTLELVVLGEVSAEARYNRVDVIACGRHAVLQAAPRLVSRARARAIPSATL